MSGILRLVVICTALCPCVCPAQDVEAPADEIEAPDNSVAINALVRLTRDQEATVRMTAFSAISRIGEETPEVIAAVQAGLKDDEDSVRIEAFYALTSAINDGKVKVDGLLTLIKDDNEEIAVHAAEQLGRLGKPAIPHLVEALKDEELRVLVVRTLGSIGTDARDAIPALTELLKSDDTELRTLVASCLGQICGPPSVRTSSRSVDPATIQRMLDTVWPRYDSDGDGILSPKEQAGFRGLDPSADRNRDGKITRAEFANWYAAFYRSRPDPRGVPARGGFGGGRPAPPR